MSKVIFITNMYVFCTGFSSQYSYKNSQQNYYDEHMLKFGYSELLSSFKF